MIEQIVVVMAGDDGDEQRTEQNRKGVQRSMVVVMDKVGRCAAFVVCDLESLALYL